MAEEKNSKQILKTTHFWVARDCKVMSLNLAQATLYTVCQGCGPYSCACACLRTPQYVHACFYTAQAVF
jgi:hypothetical protein